MSVQFATDDPHAAPLVGKARQIWDMQNTRMHHPTSSSTEWSSFLSPENITRYLHLFWTRCYRHCPIVHQATFDLARYSPLLLATMSLIGACMSSLDSDNQSAKSFLDAIEGLIFSNPLFLESPRLGNKNENLLQTRENIQTLQATCFICLLQKWEGSATAKLRMQRHRFMAFVATTRAMGLSQTVHHRIDLTSNPTVVRMEARNDHRPHLSRGRVPSCLARNFYQIIESARASHFASTAVAHGLCAQPMRREPDSDAISFLNCQSALNFSQ
ncbi:uncharacterized protein BDV17DRAFT_213329 [Aspergillus undulatus]|uniref:uncharacterized protein n=1 Tax=Aspergillus undulatus TaxID=1810928 RepID=UPI003CCDA3C5